jgi:DNA-binding IclR family transcriptional regulator
LARSDERSRSAAAGSSRREAGAKTLENGVRLMQILAEHPDGMTMTELANAGGIHRTVAYRLLASLQKADLVEHNEKSGYLLGVGLIQLAASVHGRLQDVAATVLRNLADEAGATAFVAVLNKDEVVTIAVVEPAGTTVRVACRIGQRHAATIGADGMAILAGRAAVEGERLEITQGRRFGYLVSVSEIQLGAWGLASPILQHNRECEASVGVIALRPMDELTVSRLVLIAAKELGLRAFERA